ncbi:MAG: CsgG/HfaB family protein [Synergistaceae bacterium]|nr:CsgG/HfaB family protein [Synergistaceae bacterium]
MKKTIVVMLCFFSCLLAPGAEGADKSRVLVLEFQSKINGVSDRQAASVTDIFLHTLLNSQSINVVEQKDLEKFAEEQQMDMSDPVDEDTAIRIGKKHGDQYLVLGSITKLDRGTSGGEHEAWATLDVRVVDVDTSQTWMSLSESGYSNSNQKFSANKLLSESEIGELKARAVMDAASRLGHEIREKLGREYTFVTSISGKNYRIDAGSYKGVQEGALYVAYVDGKPMSAMNEFETVNLALLRVQDVQDDYSVCVLESPSQEGLIERGDKIRPVAPSKAREMTFVTSRPSSLPPNLPLTSSLALQDSAAPKWLLEKSDVPIQLQKESNRYFAVEGISGGIKAQTRKGSHYWRSWHVGTAMSAAGKLWGFEGEIERLDTGGSGIMFGNEQEFMAVCLTGSKLKLIQYRLRPARTATLSEVPLEEKHKEPGKFTMLVEVVHGTGSITCVIDDTTYSFKGKFKIPLLKQYGFFGSAADSSVSTTSIFRKISLKRGNG